MTRVDVSIVIPAYNEARRLPLTLEGWRAFLGQQPYTSEVLVVDDGSADATSRVAADGGARVIRLEPNQGKGGAVRAGMLAADGQVIAYADADMNVAPTYLTAALARLQPQPATDRPGHSPAPEPRGGCAGRPGHSAAAEPGGGSTGEPGGGSARRPGSRTAGEPGDGSADEPGGRSTAEPRSGSAGGPGRSGASEPGGGFAGASGRSGADLVIGRRNLAEYAAAEGPVRLLAGGLVQVTRRALVLRGIQDTQCGFKVFRRDLARAVFARTRLRSFAFDIEVLFVARKLGARIVEIPVTTTFRAESTFNPRRHLPGFLRDIVQIRLNDQAGRYDPPG